MRTAAESLPTCSPAVLSIDSGAGNLFEKAVRIGTSDGQSAPFALIYALNDTSLLRGGLYKAN